MAHAVGLNRRIGATIAGVLSGFGGFFVFFRFLVMALGTSFIFIEAVFATVITTV